MWPATTLFVVHSVQGVRFLCLSRSIMLDNCRDNEVAVLYGLSMSGSNIAAAVASMVIGQLANYKATDLASYSAEERLGLYQSVWTFLACVMGVGAMACLRLWAITPAHSSRSRPLRFASVDEVQGVHFSVNA